MKYRTPLPKLPKQESFRNLPFYTKAYLIIIGILIVVALVVLLILTSRMEAKALQNCLDNGYTENYCKTMLN
jgi:flagellar biosynthesis/type III secretory pathway M-ring protein FliF/YscJ